jgi:hypothetical protein
MQSDTRPKTTSYATASGGHCHGCYTDAWAHRDGHWLAVGAYVTR